MQRHLLITHTHTQVVSMCDSSSPAGLQVCGSGGLEVALGVKMFLWGAGSVYSPTEILRPKTYCRTISKHPNSIQGSPNVTFFLYSLICAKFMRLN